MREREKEAYFNKWKAYIDLMYEKQEYTLMPRDHVTIKFYKSQNIKSVLDKNLYKHLFLKKTNNNFFLFEILCEISFL